MGVQSYDINGSGLDSQKPGAGGSTLCELQMSLALSTIGGGGGG